jgi:ABC-type spermidine/putrescine transport system permease subunit I
MALRAGIAAASLLGVMTTFGTTLWIATVVLLVALVFGLTTAELLPRLQQNARR